MSVAATTLGLVALEGVSRVAATLVDDVDRFRQDVSVRHAVDPGLVGSPEFGWIRQPGFRGLYVTHRREYDGDGYRAIDSAQTRASDEAKVLFLGDSNTFGYDVADSATFVEVMERLVPGCAAINLGVPGYSSYQGWLVAKEYIPRLAPKVAIISFNYNDRRYTFMPPGPDGPARSMAVDRMHGIPWQRRVVLGLRYVCLARGLRRALRMRPWAADELADTTADLSQVEPRVGEEAYRQNLSQIVTLCLQHGVTPVFLLLRDNPLRTAPLRAAHAALERGETATAMQELLLFIEGDEGELADLARVELAAARRRAGGPAGAAVLTHVEPSLDGQTVVRLDADYNRILREVAEAYGAEVVDGASVLESAPDVFVDVCHFNEEGHRRVAQALAPVVSRILSGATAP